jgi:hypothetical protein
MDALFQQIETWYNKPFTSVLDAGTGENSLRWLLSVQTQSITAVTGDPYRKKGLDFSYGNKLRKHDRILYGNWRDNDFLQREQFDVVIADYLLGAMDGFAPYFQIHLFGKLKQHMKKKIYIIGLEPYPHIAQTTGGQLILTLSRLRDACILLAKHRCYREYPMEWVLANLQSHSLHITNQQKFPIVYQRRFIDEQLQVCRSKLHFLPANSLKSALHEEIANLEQKLHNYLEIHSSISFGFDYVIEAEHAD